MKLSIFLFQEEVTTFNNVIQKKCLEGNECYVELSPRRDLSYECKAYVQRERKKQPTWSKFLSSHFDLEMYNTTNSFILLVKVQNRIFAATFGYGFNALNRVKIEPQFGLKVTLNTIGTDQIDTIDTRNVDLVTKQRRTHINVGSSIGQFGINEFIDLVRYVSGKPQSGKFAKKLSGSDSLGITRECKVEDLGKICEELIEKYNSNNYKLHFEFVDYLRPLPKIDPKVLALNKELTDRIKNRGADRITLANPEIPDSSIVSYKIYISKKCSLDLEELTLDGVYKFFQENGVVEGFLDKVKIVGFDSEGNPKTIDYKLRDYIVCEILSDTETYILSLGQWFKVDTNFVQTVRRRIQSIPDVTQDLLLPPIKKNETEGKYNERISKLKGWLLVDKALFRLDGSQNKFEPCDILTENREFLCVKKMESSATLSHLFSQASVSAKLLRSDSRVEDEVKNRYESYWTGKKYHEASEPKFIYVIPTEKVGALYDCMFFFSLINLVDHVDTIKAMGYKVSLCKVEYEK